MSSEFNCNSEGVLSTGDIIKNHIELTLQKHVPLIEEERQLLNVIVSGLELKTLHSILLCDYDLLRTIRGSEDSLFYRTINDLLKLDTKSDLKKNLFHEEEFQKISEEALGMQVVADRVYNFLQPQEEVPVSTVIGDIAKTAQLLKLFEYSESRYNYQNQYMSDIIFHAQRTRFPELIIMTAAFLKDYRTIPIVKRIIVNASFEEKDI